MTKAKSKHQTRHKKCFFLDHCGRKIPSHMICTMKKLKQQVNSDQTFLTFHYSGWSMGIPISWLMKWSPWNSEAFHPLFWGLTAAQVENTGASKFFSPCGVCATFGREDEFPNRFNKKGTEITLNFVFIYIHIYIYVYIKLSIHSTYTCNVHSMYISFFLCILKHISTRICEKLPPISKSGRQFPSNRNWEPRAGGAKDAAAPGGEIK